MLWPLTDSVGVRWLDEGLDGQGAHSLAEMKFPDISLTFL